MKYAITGTYEEFVALKESNPKKFGEFEFLYDFNDVNGAKCVVFAGTYYARGDLIAIGQILLVDFKINSKILNDFQCRTADVAMSQYYYLGEMPAFGDTYNICSWPISQEQRDKLRKQEPESFWNFNSYFWDIPKKEETPDVVVAWI